jgi:predicted Zn-ribbon and HTH transcriptional regulator
MKKNIMKKIKCKYCGYEWESRVKNPKSCPLCKRYLIEKPGEE